MNYYETIKEGGRAIKSNLLRSSLTVLIIAIGITSLVGILTAIDGLQASITSGLASLGSKSFEISKQNGQQRRRAGEKQTPEKDPINYREAKMFREKFSYTESISISTKAADNIEAKYLSKKTNPNIRVFGIEPSFFAIKELELEYGRNFTPFELDNGVSAAIIGAETAEALFPGINPSDKFITIAGEKFQVVGAIKKSGSLGSSGSLDRNIYVPVEKARRMAGGAFQTYTIVGIIDDPAQVEMMMGEAESAMRVIRQDKLGEPSSFEISRSESVSSQMNAMTGSLRVGGLVIGFITLAGASIGLMNIMMVSVTERTREIGVRKALGAKPSIIQRQFLIEAILICQIGGLVGIFMGILIGNLVSILVGGAFLIPWGWMLASVLICVVVGIVSGYYPAYRASKFDPIVALRYE